MRLILTSVIVLSWAVAAQAQTIVPLEPGTTIAKHQNDEVTIKLVNTLVMIVKGKGMSCSTVTAAGFTDTGFKLVCDHYKNAYDIDVRGQNPIVTRS